ncbi:MAG: aldehyde dehydrogenase family protein [Bacteroidetes bacterium]|nr:aldehyde dehydrogenase family protein [Bacteroidota bacterium]
MSKHYKYWVGGKHVSSDDKHFVVDPYTGSTVGITSLATQEDINSALDFAVEAFQIMKSMSSYNRAELLLNIAKRITNKKDFLANLISAEAGKPIKLAHLEVQRAISTFTIASEEAKRIQGEVIPLDNVQNSNVSKGILTRHPIGVLLSITPYNYPLNLLVHKIAPAIACGNSFIIKPAPQTPLTALVLGEILLEAGVPEKTINILPCTNELAEKLITDDRVKIVSFTGSAKVGWMIRQLASNKKNILELGGNAASIIDETSDIDDAVLKSVKSAFAYAGQVCIKLQRILIHEDIYPEFAMKFVEETSKLIIGSPANEDTFVGPMISVTEADRVHNWIMEAKKQGANILWGGNKKGSIIMPTIFENIKSNMKVWNEEVFGPVVCLKKFKTIDEAIQLVNDSKYGLQASIFSNNHASIMKASNDVEVGALIVNEAPSYRNDTMPYGGIKQSGFGREGVKYAIEEMTEPKLLIM